MYQQIVVLTGAGISAGSGLSTFRDENGLWEDHHIEDVATPEGYQRDPNQVERFYNARRQQFLMSEIVPNEGHIALAYLEQASAGELLIVTQNIDDLHERAGSKKLVHMHGELAKGRCPGSGQTFTLNAPFGVDNTCTCCIPGQRLRPHVVWFGEIPLGLSRIQQALATCDLFIAVGTSGTVYPAAGFVELAKHHGAQTVEVNLLPPSANSQFQYHLQGKASDVLPQLIEGILQGKPLSELSR